MSTYRHKFILLSIAALFSICLANTPANAGWQIETVDPSISVGLDTSLAFDASGNPSISHFDWRNGRLKYAHFNGTSWVNTVVDSSGGVGGYTSLAFDASGNPAISYLDVGNSNLKFARFFARDATCQCPIGSSSGCISGQVTEKDTGVPLAWRSVRFEGRLLPEGPRIRMKTLTDDNGCYQFFLPEGTSKIKVSRCRGRKIVGVPYGWSVNNVNFECR